MDTNEFIEKAILVHGDLYDYSKVEYINSKTDVIIIDPEYGEFKQRASRHLSGSNHPTRSNVSRRLSQKEILKRFKEVHGDLYDYSKVEYINNNTKVIVIDPEYGEFTVTPGNHIRKKSGHPKRSFDKNRLTQEDFIERCKFVHNGFYDYSKVNYINSSTKIIIIDPEYGEFKQKAGNHLSGQGNPRRAFDKLKLTQEEFIEKSNIKHKHFYDYSKVEYINSYTKVIIIDPEYGEFKLTPQYHLAGGGHPKRSYNHVYEIDHIIPISFICKSSERSLFKNNKIYQLLDSSINKKIVLREENRNKGDCLILFGKKIRARDYRNDYEIIRYLFLREHRINIDLENLLIEKGDTYNV